MHRFKSCLAFEVGCILTAPPPPPLPPPPPNNNNNNDNSYIALCPKMSSRSCTRSKSRERQFVQKIQRNIFFDVIYMQSTTKRKQQRSTDKDTRSKLKYSKTTHIGGKKRKKKSNSILSVPTRLEPSCKLTCNMNKDYEGY